MTQFLFLIETAVLARAWLGLKLWTQRRAWLRSVRKSSCDSDGSAARMDSLPGNWEFGEGSCWSLEDSGMGLAEAVEGGTGAHQLGSGGGTRRSLIAFISLLVGTFQ